TQRLAQARHEVERRLDGAPVRRALGLMARDAGGHVLVARLRRGDVDDARAGRQAGDREAALTTALAAEAEERRSQCPQVLARRPVVMVRARAGLLALGSSYSPRLPSPTRASGSRGFRPRLQ